MDAPLAVATLAREAGVVVAALAVAGSFALRAPAARAASLLLAGALVPALLVAELWDGDRFRDALSAPLTLAAAAAGLVLAAAIGVLFVRRPRAFPLLVVGALAFRVPVEVGGQSANLLVPLYVVIAGGCLGYGWRELRRGSSAASANGRPPGRPHRGLALLLAGSVVLYALQALYSTDFDQALRNVVFFYVPFALLMRVLTAVEWSRALVVRCLTLAAGLALALAAVGFWEYAAREVLLDPNAAAASEFQSFFRVNSLFFDPNAYGQFLAVVMLLVAALVLWGRRRRDTLVATVVLTVLWAALVLTFSQSSFAALLAGLAVLAGLRWSPRIVGGAVGAATLVGVVILLAAPGIAGIDLGSDSRVNDATSGRFRLVTGGLEMFADRPLWGYGSGSFAERYRERERVSQFGTSISHTTPVTVAAEQGVVGLALYVAVLAAAARLLLGGLGGLRPRLTVDSSQLTGGAPAARLAARAAVAAAAVALVVHTMFYGGFLENPLTWTLGAAAIALRRSDPAVEAEVASAALSEPLPARTPERPPPARATP